MFPPEWRNQWECLFLLISLNAVGNVLLQIVVEEAVVKPVVGLWAKHRHCLFRESVNLGVGCRDDDRAADKVNTGIGKARSDKFALNIKRSEVVLGRGIGVITLPVDGIDAHRTRSKHPILGILVAGALGVP